MVNVSGFHVDPGYCGQLTFAVFNAGPVPVHLRRGQPTFLIWYASLDRETDFKKDGKVHKGIDSDIVTAISGELQSFASLSNKINDIDKSLSDRIHKIEKKQVKFNVIGLIAVGIIVALAGVWLTHAITWLTDAIWAPLALAPQPPSVFASANAIDHCVSLNCSRSDRPVRPPRRDDRRPRWGPNPFRACSAFTRVPAYLFAKLLNAAL